jgi:UTP-glucose-1-phosphate uridylyltransferase
MKPALVVLAAGIGDRYGGLKQTDRVGPSGETIVDYSIYDAVRAGFGKVVFVIRKNIENEFREVFLHKLKNKIEIDYVFQELEDIPAGLSVPPGRRKPWGTSHAVLVAEPKIKEPFAAINADDFYGRRAFHLMADFLKKQKNSGRLYSLVGYELGGTLSEHGSVARGVCEVGDKKMLSGIVERTHLEKTPAGIIFKDEAGEIFPLGGRTTVSMNFWGFTPTFFKFVEEEFERFVRENVNHPQAELYIPLVVNKLVKSAQARVRVLPCLEKWFGVTYRDDKPRVIKELKKLVTAGVYPDKLWA